VINLVHKLVSLPNHTPALVLLDEPETSLYPGAQRRLLKFLLEIIKEKHCQIIISTHSEKFVAKLPPTAVKAIHLDLETGKSFIINECEPSAVFDELEIPQQKYKIFVEDRAANILIKK
jgi:Predicted ATPase